MAKATIYIYPSKKMYVEKPESPILFFNLKDTEYHRKDHNLFLKNKFNWINLWNIEEKETGKL